jgi:hypothetical protein
MFNQRLVTLNWVRPWNATLAVTDCVCHDQGTDETLDRVPLLDLCYVTV